MPAGSFHYIWHQLPYGLQDELIEVNVTLPNTHFGHNSRIHALIMSVFYTLCKNTFLAIIYSRDLEKSCGCISQLGELKLHDPSS